MGQATGSALYNTFTKGLITDSSNLNSDPNSIKDGYNFYLTNRGTLEKRLGLSEETSFATSTYTSESDLVISEATTFDGKKWYLIYDKTTRDFSVRDAADDSEAISKTVDGIDTEVSFSYNDRFILVTSTWQYNFVLEYNGTVWTDEGNVEVFVRDFDGVDDGLATDERPSTLEDLHRYNLENQGWGERFNDTEQFNTDIGSYPSNADIASLGVYTVPSTQAKAFRSSNITNTYIGNSLAPRGKKVLSTLDIYPRKFLDETTLSEGAYPFGDTSVEVCTTFFAGRAFYGAGNNIMFSQTLGQDSQKFGRCHQDADPTSSEISDLIDTDGGLIKISGASGIFKLVELGRQLIVFANNGIWAISGGEATFTATTYSIQKVSTYTAVSPTGIVQVPDGILFLSTSGILALQQDQVSLEASAQNLTKGIIQDYYNTFSAEDLQSARLVYSVKEENVYFIIGTEVLVFSSTLGAFFKLQIPSGSIGALYQDDVQVIVQDSQVVYGGVPVLHLTDPVVIGLDTTVSVVPQVRFLYLSGGNVSIKSFSDTTYLDNGTTDYDSFFVTTNLMFDSALTIKRIPQLSCFFEKTETGYTENVEGGLEYVNPSQCSFQVGWDMPLTTSYNNDPRNKWSRVYSAYRLSRYEAKDIGEIPGEALDSIITRTSIRGRGRSAMLRFSSDPGYDCRLLGWNMDINQTTRNK